MRARIRTVKPEIFHDEDLWELGERTGMPVYQGFQGLWCYADREGRFEWRPKALKALVLPYWSGDFEALLGALLAEGMLARYDVGGRQYGLVVNLKNHQAFNAREPASRLPPPPPGTCTHVRAHARHGGNGNGNGNGTDLSLAPEGAAERDDEGEHPEPDDEPDDEPEPAPLEPEPETRSRRATPKRARPRRATTRSHERMHEHFPEGWREWSAETTRAAAAHGLTAADLAGHVDFWTTRNFAGGPVRASMLDVELRRDLKGIAQRKADAAVRAHAGGAPAPASTMHDWRPTAEHRKFCAEQSPPLDVDQAAREYRAGGLPGKLGTLRANDDFMARLRWWAKHGEFIAVGSPQRPAKAVNA